MGSHIADLGQGLVISGILLASQASSGKTTPSSLAQCTSLDSTRGLHNPSHCEKMKKIQSKSLHSKDEMKMTDT